jgi:hypothetical protein
MKINWTDETTTFKDIKGSIQTVKTKQMTQRTKLELEIKELQDMLMQKALVSDAFTTIGIFKELEIKKSILLNLD